MDNQEENMEEYHRDHDHDEEMNENEGLLEGNGFERNWSEIQQDKSTSYREPLLRKRMNTTSQIAIVGANVCPIESLDYE